MNYDKEMQSKATSGQSQYKGSQAFNQYLALVETVNPSTGTLTLTQPLIKLAGIKDSINLDINLVYNPNSNGILDLPDGWTLDINYVIPGKSITTKGRSYIIDDQWADNTGYKSGLRYVNNHGMKFEIFNPSRKLPSGNPGSYTYSMTYPDGSHDYFDINGKLLEQNDRFRNFISYFYKFTEGVTKNYLDKITDSFGNVITFSYDSGAKMVITFPNGAKTTVNYSQQGVYQLINPLNNATNFHYEQFGDKNIIYKINYPTGLTTSVTYQKIEYLSQQGVAGFFPAVSNLVHISSSGAVLEKTLYTYGENTAGYTFTGYAGGYKLSNDDDGLMESENAAYVYDVSISKLMVQDNAADKLLSLKTIYHNYLHLPIYMDELKITDGAASQGHRTNFAYNIIEDMHARSINYDKPINIKTSTWSKEEKDYTPLSVATYEYDLFGNSTDLTKSFYDPINNIFVFQSQTSNSYTKVSWDDKEFEMLTSSILHDLVSGYQKQTTHTLTTDQKNIAGKYVTYKNAGDLNWTPWQEQIYLYNDPHARITSKNIQWSKGSNPDPDSILSTTESYAYSYDQSTFQLQVVTTNALGDETTKVFDTTLVKKPMVQMKTPLGNTTVYEYDLLGRLNRKIDPKGFVKTFEYHMQATDGENSVIVTDPIGYIKKTCYDELNRMTKVMDNGDPTKLKPTQVTRILNQTTYNFLGKKYQVIDRLGLTSIYEYDGFGRCIQLTDPYGNVNITQFDDGNCLVHNFANNILRSTIQHDGLGRERADTGYSDPADKKINYAIKKSTEYDAWNNKTKVTLSQVDKTNNQDTVLQQITLSYNADNKPMAKDFTGYGTSKAQITEKIVYDLSGKILHSQRQYTYADGRSYVKKSERSKYNVIGLLLSRTNLKGQVESHAYDKDGRLHTKTRYDDTLFTFDYDNNNNLETTTWVEKDATGADIKYNITNTFYESNEKSSVSDGKVTINYEYYQDKSLKTVTYPKGKQAYILDQYSRVSNLIDASGTATVYTYYDEGPTQGLPYTVKQGNDSVLYSYTTDSSAFPHQAGLLTNIALSGGKTINRSYQYDGFFHVNEVEIKDSSNTLLLSSQFEHNALNQLTNLTQSSPINTHDKAVNFARSFAYDGAAQLISSKTSYGDGSLDDIAYTYDGNMNVLSMIENSNVKSFEYNELDQLHSPEIKYDTNGRLTQDSDYKYVYNQLDQIRQVTTTDGNPILDYQYYPDGLLSSRAESNNELEFYYNSNVVNAIASSSTDVNNKSWTRFLLSRNDRLAAYEDNQDPFYYFSSHNSTALVMDGNALTGLDYEAYGAVKKDIAAQQSIKASKCFTWNQEYTDPSTGLVYLRSRFYNPKIMRFMSMDTTPLANRYAFGNGDPINMIDPTGHGAEAMAGHVILVSVTALTLIFSALVSLFTAQPEIFAGALNVLGASTNVGGATVASIGADLGTDITTATANEATEQVNVAAEQANVAAAHTNVAAKTTNVTAAQGIRNAIPDGGFITNEDLNLAAAKTLLRGANKALVDANEGLADANTALSAAERQVAYATARQTLYNSMTQGVPRIPYLVSSGTWSGTAFAVSGVFGLAAGSMGIHSEREGSEAPISQELAKAIPGVGGAGAVAGLLSGLLGFAGL
jgi:RHS repeat-associated protein